MALKRCEIPDYLNNLYSDFKDTLMKHLASMFPDDGVRELTLYGNVYAYVNDECDGVEWYSYRKLIRISDDHLDVEVVVKDMSGENKTIRICVRNMSADMILDMIENIP